MGVEIHGSLHECNHAWVICVVEGLHVWILFIEESHSDVSLPGWSIKPTGNLKMSRDQGLNSIAIRLSLVD